ncbi:MAG TPA: NAD(P)-dependent alcohol dehydrogenase, partial [Phycisphaerales bacterium]|nr:NAD(P)-dependent alcohol dehydrogenase [Phycisphaerales bacterium]
MFKTSAFAAQSGESPLALASIDRRDPGPRDVQIEILYCGVCHSDLHASRGQWPGMVFPLVPGHEIVGRVTKAGADAKSFKIGDHVAVGCMVDSCQKCPNCAKGLEQYCDVGMVLTYNSPDAHMPGKMTYGGYSKSIVVNQRFVLRVSKDVNLAATAPLLCAGITTYSPLKHWGATKGKKVGVVGLGGLGHMGVKFSRAFGCHTVLFTTSPNKIEDGKRLGADEVVISRDEAQMNKHAGSFDFILNTV